MSSPFPRFDYHTASEMNAETMGGVERRGVNCLRIKNTIEKSDTEKLRLKRWKMKIHDIILILILNLSNTSID